MNSLNSTLRKWLLPLLLNFPSQGLLEVIHITFSFVVPFPWPVDLHDWMLTISATLEAVLMKYFTRLQVVTLKFDLRNAHTRPFDWNDFNQGIQPKKLIARGVKCNFSADVYRSWSWRHETEWAFLTTNIHKRGNVAIPVRSLYHCMCEKHQDKSKPCPYYFLEPVACPRGELDLEIKTHISFSISLPLFCFV